MSQHWNGYGRQRCRPPGAYAPPRMPPCPQGGCGKAPPCCLWAAGLVVAVAVLVCVPLWIWVAAAGAALLIAGCMALHCR